MILIISAIDNRLLTNVKLFGTNIVWITFIIGALVSAFSEKNTDYRNDYIENVKVKEDEYRHIVQNIINVPDVWKAENNYTAIFKKISKVYIFSLLNIVNETISIITFPIVWLKLILQAKNIIKFFKTHSKKIEGLGTISTFSYFDINTFKSMKEKQNTNDITFNDRKFINSYLYFYRIFNENFEIHDDVINLDNDHRNASEIEERLFQIYIKQINPVGVNVDKCREDFFLNIFYYISKVYLF
jgi:hypothetical protein